MNNSIFDWAWLIAENAWLYGGTFILILSILVFIHEWGHYIVARMNGVRIDTFSIGFGPELFGRTDKNGTRWKFSLIPLGGYVKMFGDMDPASAQSTDGVEDGETGDVRPMTDEERKVAFFAQSVLARCAIVFAGPAINFLFAIAVLAGLYMFYGQPVTPPIATAVLGDSAAAKAGFEPHDQVIAIDGDKIRRFEDIRMEVTIGLDTEREFTILRDDKEIKLKASPTKLTETDRFGFSHSRGLLGLISPGNAIDMERIKSVDGVPTESIESVRKQVLRRMDTDFIIEIDRGEQSDTLFISPMAERNKALNSPDDVNFNFLVISDRDDEIFIKHNPAVALYEALLETKAMTLGTLDALGQMITGTRSATELGGIIRIGAIAGDMAQSGMIALITFAAILSINLGLINLFPIPMLDGGHLMFYAIEGARGKPLSDNIQEYAFRIGMVILVGFMLFANLNDVVQIAK